MPASITGLISEKAGMVELKREVSVGTGSSRISNLKLARNFLQYLTGFLAKEFLVMKTLLRNSFLWKFNGLIPIVEFPWLV